MMAEIFEDFEPKFLATKIPSYTPEYLCDGNVKLFTFTE